MRAALDRVGEHRLETPPGLVRVKISPDSGLLVSADDPDAIFEVFREGHLPEREIPEPVDIFNDGQVTADDDTLF